MDWENVEAAPIAAAAIVILAIIALGSISFAFSGHIQF